MKDPLRDLLDLYDEDAAFNQYVLQDLDDGAVWFNLKEFARHRDIDGERVLCVFCGARQQRIEIRQQDTGQYEGVYRNNGILFVRADEIEGEFEPGAPVRLDDKIYTVQAARLLQDLVWRVELEANDE